MMSYFPIFTLCQAFSPSWLPPGKSFFYSSFQSPSEAEFFANPSLVRPTLTLVVESKSHHVFLFYLKVRSEAGCAKHEKYDHIQ